MNYQSIEKDLDRFFDEKVKAHGATVKAVAIVVVASVSASARKAKGEPRWRTSSRGESTDNNAARVMAK